jgi:phospho-N-acetylmuramoyl-pentapeptide-transferase
MPPYIKALRKRKMQQFLRVEGPKTHIKKAGTPTAGGVMFAAVFLVVVLVGWLAFAYLAPPGTSAIRFQALASFPVVMAAVLCGLLGFFDDSAKIRNKSNAGLSAKMRLIAEAIIGFIVGLMVFPVPHHVLFDMDKMGNLSYATSEFLFHFPPLFLLLAIFLMMATTNSVNLHDGMDGMCGGTSLMALATLAILLGASGQPVLAMVAATACGAIGGFLVFNKYPAQIFMGDTGSLFIGGLMAGLVAAGGMVVYFIPLSLIYIAEAVSVMAQFSYFRATKEWVPEDETMSGLSIIIYKITHSLPGEGKRLLRMAPLHHHFEAVFGEQGASEADVTAGFWVVQFMLCTVVLALFFGSTH